MKKITLRIFSILLFVNLVFSLSNAADFIYNDIPRMPGMFVAEPMSFDTSEGRVVDVSTSVKSSAKNIAIFYHTSLSNLGWKHLGGGMYIRENERLKVIIGKTDKDGTSVSFSLTPYNK